MTESIEKKLDEALSKISSLADELAETRALVQKLGARYQWEEKTTETGIQLAGGPTTVTKIGILRGVSALPTPQGIAFAFVLQDETSNKFAILSPELIKPV